jgi:hypothetical protein
MTPPKNLAEMTSFIELRKQIFLEYDNKAKEFTIISDNFQVLGIILNQIKLTYSYLKNTFNYILEINNIQMPEVMKIKYEKLFKIWSVYKNTLEDAEIMLKTKQNEFMNSLMEKQTNLKINAKNLLQSFLENAPISTEWNSKGKLKKILYNFRYL